MLDRSLLGTCEVLFTINEERCPSLIYECKGSIFHPYYLCFFCHILVLATKSRIILILLGIDLQPTKEPTAIISRHLPSRYTSH